jgi:hypothetical protein
MQDELRGMLASHIQMMLRMVISGIVDNDGHPSTASRTNLPEMFKKHMERHSVKSSLLSSENQFSIPQSDGPEVPDTLAGRMVQQNRIDILRGHPHPTTRPILLKMNFIGRPQIDSWIGGELWEFFYMPPEVQDRPGRSETAVSVNESQRT